MIGAMFSSLSLAQRTASQARATMETMARQIATGQKVASVKDDGAAWARAAAMRSDQVVRNEVRMRLTDGTLRASIAKAGIEESRAMVARLRDLALSASTQTNPSAFAATVREFSTLHAAMVRSDHVNRWGIYWSQTPAQVGYANDGALATAAQAFSLPNLDGSSTASIAIASMESHGPTGHTLGVSGPNWYIEAAPGARLYYQGTTPLADWNPVLADAAMAREAAAYMETVLRLAAGPDARLGALMRQFESQDRFNDRMMDKADLGAGAISDADLGAASAARARAETRQQLALSTVREAISTYGNFVGGLLGNVQRTQRGVMA